MKLLLLTLVTGFALSAQPGYYGGYRGGYDPSPAARIERGVRSGLLTPREADRLYRMERELRFETQRAYRSGYGISPREQRRLEEMRYRLDREISRELADGERSYRGGYHSHDPYGYRGRY
jgi:hypothetical protein